MFCSGCRGKSTKKRQQQGEDDKIEEMNKVSIKRRWGNGSTNDEIQKLRTKTNPFELG
jgi:hypothetical protein